MVRYYTAAMDRIERWAKDPQLVCWRADDGQHAGALPTIKRGVGRAEIIWELLRSCGRVRRVPFAVSLSQQSAPCVLASGLRVHSAPYRSLLSLTRFAALAISPVRRSQHGARDENLSCSDEGVKLRRDGTRKHCGQLKAEMRPSISLY
jgi:hypothetical protein